MRRIRGLMLSSCAAMLVAAMALVAPNSSAGASNTKGTLNIGLICQCSGAQASSTVVGPPGFLAWAKGVNASGGIDGYKVNPIVDDDAGNPATSLAQATSLINDDHVLAIVDATSEDTTWGALAQKSHVPVINGGSNGELEVTDPDYFNNSTTVDAFGLIDVVAAKRVGAKVMGVFYCAESPQCSLGLPLIKATAQKLGGTSLAYTTSISGAAPNYVAQCLAAKAAGVTALSVADATTVNEHVAADCKMQGFTPWYLTGDGSVAPSLLSSPGLDTKAIGFETDVPYWVTNTPATEKYQKLMKKYEASDLADPNYNELTVGNYVAGLIFETALKAGMAGKSGPVTTSDIYDGLYSSFHGNTLGGMAPPLTYKKGQATPVDCWYWIAVKNHKFTTPYGLQPYCQKPPKGT
jgi:branched-chain amino acid transport system substrate-binding protein